MKSRITLFFLLFVCFNSYGTFTPISVTGFNQDIIANGNGPAASSTTIANGFDNGGYSLVAQDYFSDPYTPDYFLPNGGLVSSSQTTGLTFQLADYSQNNALYLVNSGDAGTLTFNTPQSAGAIYLLGTSGNGASTVDVTVTFSDNSTQFFSTVLFDDWYYNSGSVNGIGRVSVTDNHTEGDANDPSLYEQLLALDAANYGLQIVSITVTKTSATGYFALLAVTANDVCVGTPVAGPVAATQATGCSEYFPTISTNANSIGLTYQWQSSNDNTIWTDVPTAVYSTYQPDVTASIYYRVYTTCTLSGLTDTAASIYLELVTAVGTYAAIPYSQGFENWIGTCYNADRPDEHWLQAYNYTDASWRRDDQGSDAGWFNVNDGAYTPASSEGSHSARFHADQQQYTSSYIDLYVDLSTPGTKQVSFDNYISDAQESMDILLSEDGGANFNMLGTVNNGTGWVSSFFNFNSTSATAIIRFRANNQFAFADMGLDNVQVYILTGCTGTPVAGNVLSTQVSGCAEYFPTLSLNMDNTIGGFTYQWQSSDDNVIWSDIPAATNATYGADIVDNTYFRVYVTCTASGETDTSTSVLEAYVTPVATYATIPYFESFESWIGTCNNFDRPGQSWIMNPTQGNASWRRDDQGSDANWGVPNLYTYSPEASDGVHSARMHTGENDYGVQGIMDLYVDMSTPGVKVINFDFINQDGDDHLFVEYSEDNGATFTQLGEYNTSFAWQPVTLYSTSIAPQAILRFRAVADFETSDIGLDSLSISLVPSCSSTPVAGDLAGTQTNDCAPYTSTLSFISPTVASGITYQWQSSADNATWANIPGATDVTYTTNILTTTYFRAYVNCNAAGTDTSTSIQLTYTGPTAVYATMPFSESFENWIPECYSFDRPGVNWITTPTFGDNSWRRDDQGDDAGWIDETDGMYYPASTTDSHSARFHTLFAGSGTMGSMMLYIDLSAAGTKQISFDFINNDGNDNLVVELSEDGGNTYTALGTYTTQYPWAMQFATTTSTSPSAIIRFRATSDQGSSDIGIDNLFIDVLTACAGTPTAGAISSSAPTASCAQFNTHLSIPVNYAITGLTYQWQQSADSVTWTTITGATNTGYDATIIDTVYYRVLVTCTNSGNTDTSAGLELIVIIPIATNATLPYFQGFENWIGSCSLYDRPDEHWLMGTPTGDYSWRRDDQGTDANWDFPGDGQYFPASFEADHSARFHASYASPGEGDMDLHVDMSSVGAKEVDFNYISPGPDNQLDIWVSYDGSGSFALMQTLGEADTWTHSSVILYVESPNVIIRFAGSGDFDFTDIGVDSLNIIVLPICTGAPTVGTVSSTQTFGCSPYSAVLSVDNPVALSGLTYQWQSSPDGTNWTNITGATDYTYATPILDATTYYEVKVTCTNSGLADLSNPLILTYTGSPIAYAALPYFEDFENWTAGCYTYDHPGTNWQTSPAIGYNSWRRDDQGVSDGGWADLSGAYTPASSEGLHSARFHTIESPLSSDGHLDLYLDLSTPGTKSVSFDYMNLSGGDYVAVQLSQDGGLTFSPVTAYGFTSGWEHEVFSTTATSATSILRFNATSDFGTTDIGIDSLWVGILSLVCDTPTNVTVSGINSTGATLSWTGVFGSAGYNYVIDNSTVDPTVAGDDQASTTYTASGLTPNTNYFFHVRNICGPGDTSAWVTIIFTTAPDGIASVNGEGFAISAHPNPATETVTIMISGTSSGEAWLQLTDIAGKVIATQQITGSKNTVDVSNLASGMYFINYVDSHRKQTIKINKQ